MAKKSVERARKAAETTMMGCRRTWYLRWITAEKSHSATSSTAKIPASCVCQCCVHA